MLSQFDVNCFSLLTKVPNFIPAFSINGSLCFFWGHFQRMESVGLLKNVESTRVNWAWHGHVSEVLDRLLDMTLLICLLRLFVSKGYRFRRAYIATQGPLAETSEDFWRMLWENNCNIVVMLTKLREVGRVRRCLIYITCKIRVMRLQHVSSSDLVIKRSKALEIHNTTVIIGFQTTFERKLLYKVWVSSCHRFRDRRF